MGKINKTYFFKNNTKRLKITVYDNIVDNFLIEKICLQNYIKSTNIIDSTPMLLYNFVTIICTIHIICIIKIVLKFGGKHMKISKKILTTLLSSLIIATTITPITAGAEEQQQTESSSENIIISDIETENNTANNVFTDESNKQDISVTSQAINDVTESNENLSGIITFEIPDNWRNDNANYYAHIWNGLPQGGSLYQWQTSAEKMTVNANETKATYNIPQGEWNLIIISGDSGIQTFDTVFNKNCIGDICYVTDKKFEDPIVYGRTLSTLLWKNNPDCGPHKMVTSFGNVVGNTYLPGETNQDLYNNFLNLYEDDSKIWESTVGVETGITWAEAKTKVATELGLVNEVTSVQLNKTSLTLGAGEITTLTATATPSNSSSTYIWSSSNTNVATVNSNGKITAKSAGTATITVKINNGKIATCKVTVKSAPTSVKVSATSKTLGVGESFIISESTNSGSYAGTFTWSSSNNSIATVKKTIANKAIITAKSVGTATITIKTYNGKTATCKVTVVKDKYSYADELIHTINRTRYSLGMPQLPRNNVLCDVANIRAKELSEKFDYIRPDGTYVTEIMDKKGIEYENVYETFAYNNDLYVSDQELFDEWIASEYHYEVLGDYYFDSVGVGKYKTSDGDAYWVILYILK